MGSGEYYVFAGMTYYPAGGWEDFKSQYPSYEEALTGIANMGDIDWWQIVRIIEGHDGGTVLAKGTRK